MRNYEIRLGKISKYIDVVDYIIRYIDDPPSDDDEKDLSGFMAQGHVKNASERPLDDVVFDISYSDSENSFLGLDKSGILHTDEIEPDEVMAFSFDLDIPKGTAYCTLNISANKRANGFLMRWFYKGKG